MGWFTRTRSPLAGLRPYELRRGTLIALVNVEPDFVEHIRETKPKQPRVGHEAPIALVKSGARILAYYDDQLVGEMDPEFVKFYAEEFDTLARRRHYGLTSIYIKPAKAKSPHAVGLNWGVGGYDGGVL